MSPWTTVTVGQDDMREFRRLAEKLRVPQHKLFGGMVLRFGSLTREQQEQDLGLAEPASPSNGNTRQSAKPATAKQPPTHRLPTQRRRAG